MNTFKKTAVAALAIATVTASSMAVTTSSAQAGNKFVKGFVAGAIGAAIIGGIAHANSHKGGHYGSCWYEDEKRWNKYGEVYWVRVKYCD